MLARSICRGDVRGPSAAIIVLPLQCLCYFSLRWDDHLPRDSCLEFWVACQVAVRTSGPMIRLADPEESMRHPPRRFVPILEPGTLRSQSLVFIMERGIGPDVEEPFAFNLHFVAVGFRLLTGGQRRSVLAEGRPSWGAAVSCDPG